MDPRLHPATGRVAHVSLAGRTALPLTGGDAAAVALPLADLLDAPQGARERQLAYGEAFCVIDRDRGHAFGFAEKDGYCGWLPEAALGPAQEPTHWVASTGTHLYKGPKVQSRDLAALPMGARLRVLGTSGAWAQVAGGWVPLGHLLPVGQWRHDPVMVAEGFLGAPYLWGGNSRAGLDCSGLVQMAHLACGIPCPGDSDLQEALGTGLDERAPLRRGDLLFWRGHVALAIDGTRLIHANGHTMNVAVEDMAECAARIAASGGGPVTHRRRMEGATAA